MKKQVKKDMTIAEVLKLDESLKEVLMGFGMHCFSCPCALGETLEEASEVHDIDVNFLVEKLNEQLNG